MFCSDPNAFLAFYDVDFYCVFFRKPEVGLMREHGRVYAIHIKIYIFHKLTGIN